MVGAHKGEGLMAKKASERVMRQRRQNNDRVSFVIDKEAKYLLHAQALKEGISTAEMIRRAILARCGLENWPNTSSAAYKPIRTAATKADAEKALARLQFDDRIFLEREQGKEKVEKAKISLGYDGRNAKINYIIGLLALLDGLEDLPEPHAGNEWQAPANIEFSEGALPVLRRLLSNIEVISQYDYDDETQDVE